MVAPTALAAQAKIVQWAYSKKGVPKELKIRRQGKTGKVSPVRGKASREGHPTGRAFPGERAGKGDVPKILDKHCVAT